MKNILVTGGLGYLGSHTILQIFSDYPDSSNIVIVDNLSNSKISVLSKLKKISNKNIVFIKASLNDRDIIELVIKKYNINFVIHFAGLKAVGESVTRPAKYYYNNVIGSRILFNLIKKHKIKKLIFSSSATVYGNPIYLPIDEVHAIRGLNPYANNKIDIENLLKNDPYFADQCSTIILRYFNPIGCHPSGLVGESPLGIPNNLMPYILKVALGVYQSLNIYGANYPTHDGTAIRDYIHVMDLARAHSISLDYNHSGISIFNIGSGKGYSVLDVVNEFSRVNNIKIPFTYTTRRLGDSTEVYADPKKAKMILNFSTMHTLESMCRDSYKFALENKMLIC